MIERPQYYVTKFVNPNLLDGYTQKSLALQTDSDAPFRLFGIAFYVFSSTGAVQAAQGNINVLVKFTRPNGTAYYQRHQIPAQAIQPYDAQAPNGAGGLPGPYYSYFAPVSPNQLYPPLTTVTFDFSDLPSLATSTVIAVLVGTKIYQDGAVWAPKYPQKFTSLPFDYAKQLAVSILPLTNQPFTVNPDADFVWQKCAQTDNGAAGGTPANLSVILDGELFFFTLTAVTAGTGGNAITFAVTGVGTPNLPLAVTVVGNAISVQVATDGGGVSTSTGGQIFAALNATAAVTALVTVTNNLQPVGLFTEDYGPANLTGGTGGASTAIATGLGIKFRDPSLKTYMNDYVPVELIFGFDNSQTPGVLYPEIYIPAQNQMEFDVAGLIPSISYPTDLLTLTLKGMKVYR